VIYTFVISASAVKFSCLFELNGGNRLHLFLIYIQQTGSPVLLAEDTHISHTRAMEVDDSP